jgi:uncharacterized protein (UPF0261 family)
MPSDTTVVIMGTLDTKSAEITYLAEVIHQMGVNTILMDVNMGGEPELKPDISAREIAAAGGGDILEIRTNRNTGQVTPIMIKGAIIKALELHAAGRLDGIISIGGASGTTVGTTVMKGLPFGVPKFMLSSTASMPAYAADYIGTKDITIMHSVVDIAGLNDLLKDVLVRAGGAISGMALAKTAAAAKDAGRVAAEGSKPANRPRKPLVAITEFKFSEGCCRIIRESLTARGYDVIPFHAQGIGDQALDELIDQGWFDGVLDIVPSGLSEQLLGGNRAAGPRRLLAAGERGIPMIVTPCGFDILSCGPLERRDRHDPLWMARGLAQRQLFVPDSFRVQARTSREEVQEVARETAARLNKAQGPVKFLVPQQGWSNLSMPGGALHNPENDRPLLEELRRDLTSPQVELVELDMELNSEEFARIVLEKFEGMMNTGPRS